MIEKYGVTILYSTPTSIRMHMKNGEEWAKKHDLSTLAAGDGGRAHQPGGVAVVLQGGRLRQVLHSGHLVAD